MRQQETVQECPDAPRCRLWDDRRGIGRVQVQGGNPACGLDAVPDHTAPGEQPVVFADVGRELRVDGLAGWQVQMPALQFLTITLAALVELEDLCADAM